MLQANVTIICSSLQYVCTVLCLLRSTTGRKKFLDRKNLQPQSSRDAVGRLPDGTVA